MDRYRIIKNLVDELVVFDRDMGTTAATKGHFLDAAEWERIAPIIVAALNAAELAATQADSRNEERVS